MDTQILLIDVDKTRANSLQQALIRNYISVDVMENSQHLDNNKTYDVIVINMQSYEKELLIKINNLFPYTNILVISLPLSFEEVCELVNIGVDGLYDTRSDNLNELIINKIKEWTEPLTEEQSRKLIECLRMQK